LFLITAYTPLLLSDNTGTGTGTVPGRNNVALVQSSSLGTFFVSESDHAKDFR